MYESSLDININEYRPKVLCGMGQATLSQVNHIIISFHGYGERAETQVRRMKELELPTSTLWLCPQALHSFPIKSRIHREDLPEVNKYGWSWMSKKTRDRDIQLNREYMLSICDMLAFLLKTNTELPPITVIGHSQGASQAWRTASWIPAQELIIHAGDIPPELRKQWPKLMRENLQLVCIGRSLDDQVMPLEIFQRDQSLIEKFSVQTKIWEGPGNHEWEGEWITFLRLYFRLS